MIRVLATLAAFACLTLAAGAQECTSMVEAAANLKARYGEVPAVGAYFGTQSPVPAMVFVNGETGTWTMLIAIGGCARIIGAGSQWTPIKIEPATPGENT